jgi:dTDP-4-amino-4,6-dideoxygalactose transaminase
MNLNNSSLAINGGEPVRSVDKKWLDNFTTGQAEKDAVCRVIDSGYLSLYEGSHTPDYPFSFLGGPEVQNLEKEWSAKYDVNYSIAVNSATSGLYAAIGALGIGFGDEVIVSPYTMTACALAPMIYGAIPVFADIEEDTGCLDPKSITKLISPKTKAIIIVHQFGIPADMNAILEIAQKFNIKIIEDCAQAHGAKINDKYVGTIGDIGVFSLNVNKTIQSGEGGICTTKDSDLAYRMQLIRNHGEAVVGPAGYDDITNIAGFNYRLTEVSAALSREQLSKLSHLNTIRKEMVSHFLDGVKEVEFLKPLKPRELDIATYYITPMRFIKDLAGVDRDKFISAVNAEGPMFYQGYVKPLYYQPVYQQKHLYKNGYPFTAPENKNLNMNYEPGVCKVAERLHFDEMIINEHIRLPNTHNDINDLISAILKVADS